MKAGDLVAKMNANLRAAPPPAPALAVVERGATRGRRRPRAAVAVKFTVDLDRQLHRTLRLYALDHGVDATEVVRAFIELMGDPAVAAALARRLIAEGTNGG